MTYKIINNPSFCVMLRENSVMYRATEIEENDSSTIRYIHDQKFYISPILLVYVGNL